MSNAVVMAGGSARPSRLGGIYLGIDPEELKEQPALPATSRLHVTAEMGPPVGDEHVFRSVDTLDEVAKETGKSVPQIALNWLLQTVSAIIIGARNEEQLRQNLQAVGWNLTAKQVSRLDAASAPTRIYPSVMSFSCLPEFFQAHGKLLAYWVSIG